MIPGVISKVTSLVVKCFRYTLRTYRKPMASEDAKVYENQFINYFVFTYGE